MTVFTSAQKRYSWSPWYSRRERAPKGYAFGFWPTRSMGTFRRQVRAGREFVHPLQFVHNAHPLCELNESAATPANIRRHTLRHACGCPIRIIELLSALYAGQDGLAVAQDRAPCNKSFSGSPASTSPCTASG